MKLYDDHNFIFNKIRSVYKSCVNPEQRKTVRLWINQIRDLYKNVDWLEVFSELLFLERQIRKQGNIRIRHPGRRK